MKKELRYFIPTREWIDNLKVGDNAPNCFGEDCTVSRIFARGITLKGTAYVCLYVINGSFEISQTFVEGKLDRTFQLCQEHTSAELDEIEERMTRVFAGPPVPDFRIAQIAEELRNQK